MPGAGSRMNLFGCRYPGHNEHDPKKTKYKLIEPKRAKTAVNANLVRVENVFRFSAKPDSRGWLRRIQAPAPVTGPLTVS